MENSSGWTKSEEEQLVDVEDPSANTSSEEPSTISSHRKPKPLVVSLHAFSESMHGREMAELPPPPPDTMARLQGVSRHAKLISKAYEAIGTFRRSVMTGRGTQRDSPGPSSQML